MMESGIELISEESEQLEASEPIVAELLDNLTLINEQGLSLFGFCYTQSNLIKIIKLERQKRKDNFPEYLNELKGKHRLEPYSFELLHKYFFDFIHKPPLELSAA